MNDTIVAANVVLCPACGKDIREDLEIKLSDSTGNLWDGSTGVVQCEECGGTLDVSVRHAVVFDVKLIYGEADAG